MSTSTGPGRPVPAISNAAAIAEGMSSALVTRKLCLVIGNVIPRMSASWKASVPMNAELTWPVMATIGTESMYASARPVTRFVAPGPEVAMQTPTLPVAIAYPSAACAAPCSWRTRMWRTLESNRGSYAGRIAPPGMPKMTSTPTASSEATRACAPVIVVVSESSFSAISCSSGRRSMRALLMKKPPLPGGRRGCVSWAPMATDTLSNYEHVTHGLTLAHNSGVCQNQGPSSGRDPWSSEDAERGGPKAAPAAGDHSVESTGFRPPTPGREQARPKPEPCS